MRIAMTGATGFLGSRLVPQLVTNGHEVVALRREKSSSNGADGATTWVAGDVTDLGAVEELVDGCDAVVHAAAVVDDGPGAAKEHDRVNVQGTETVLRACRSAHVARLLHVSSVAAVACKGGDVAADESAARDEAADSASYRTSKCRAESVVIEAVGNGLDAVIVNPAWMFGPHSGGFRGAEVIDNVRRRPIVPYFPGGTNVVHVDDAAVGIVAALERGRTGERYILGGENHSWRQMAEIAADELGLRRVFVPVPRAATAAAAAIGGVVERRTSRPWRFTKELHREAACYRYYDSGKAASELDYRFRPYREIVREYGASQTADA
jgi:dihydroflavonol-4-reductase